MSNEKFSQSSIGKKVLMGLTGLFLITFLIVHVTINSMIFADDGGKLFNQAAGFMAHNPIIRVVEIGLFLGLLSHVYLALKLTLDNNKARPVKYAVVNGNANSKWYSRSMGILGSLLLIFLVVHLANFWLPTKVAVFSNKEHDTFANLNVVFEEWYLVAIYLLGVIALCYHLLHGFQSAFQTLGLNHKKYTPMIKTIGAAFSIIVSILFAAMPIAMYFDFIV
jgi:succinate dehydrogenase / fumarate reductase cytochrome b subunit